MNRSEIQQKKVLLISFSPVNAGANVVFQKSFELQFKPDEVIIKQVSYSTAGNESGNVYLVTSNMLFDIDLFTFAGVGTAAGGNGYTENLEICFADQNFKLSQSPTFQVLDAVTRNPTVLALGQLSFTIEFVKYGMNFNNPH